MNQIKRFLSHWKLAIGFDPKKYWTKRGLTYFNEYPPVGDRGEDWLLKTLAELSFASLLDIGCGYGRYLKVVADRFPQTKLAGVDISSTQIAEAKRYLSAYPQIHLFETNGIDLPSRNKEFDISFTLGCLMHVPPASLHQFFREVIRVTLKKGLFYESSLKKASIKRLVSPAVVWYSHDYDALFRYFQLPYQVLRDSQTGNLIERLYLVDFTLNEVTGK